MGVSTVHYIVKRTCSIIWQVLSPIELKEPDEEEWEKELRENLQQDGAFLIAVVLWTASMLLYNPQLGQEVCITIIKVHSHLSLWL